MLNNNETQKEIKRQKCNAIYAQAPKWVRDSMKP